MSASRNGQVITFYSYKGGTGRTMALANVAWIIASSGKRVLVVDWDLESPGLHKFFEPFLEESRSAPPPAVIELISDTQRPLKNARAADDWHLDRAGREDAVSLGGSFPDGGKLDFLSAGRQNRDYSAAVCQLDWDNFYERLGGGRFFGALREDMKAELRLRAHRQPHRAERRGRHLHDSAAGHAGRCFTLSNQCIEGAANVAGQIGRALPRPEHQGAAGADADRGRREGEAGRRTLDGPHAGSRGSRSGMAQAESVAVLVVGRGALQAVLRLRGDPGHVRRRARHARLAARRVRAHHGRGDRR